jgi:hypothetical protein
MGARQKLNAAYLNGCLFAATVIGLIAQSWPLFWLVLVVSVVACCHSGDIRNRPGGWDMKRGR